MKKTVITTLFLSLVISGCGYAELKWEALRTKSDIRYLVHIQMYRNSDIPQQPFRLKVSSKAAPNDNLSFMFASDCDDVTLIQEPERLSIFYKRIDIGDFSNYRSFPSSPLILLCDLGNIECQYILKKKISNNYLANSICPYRIDYK